VRNCCTLSKDGSADNSQHLKLTMLASLVHATELGNKRQANLGSYATIDARNAANQALVASNQIECGTGAGQQPVYVAAAKSCVTQRPVLQTLRILRRFCLGGSRKELESALETVCVRRTRVTMMVFAPALS
jgi:hypothetical protein